LLLFKKKGGAHELWNVRTQKEEGCQEKEKGHQEEKVMGQKKLTHHPERSEGTQRDPSVVFTPSG
jgi:hypothetical protein